MPSGMTRYLCLYIANFVELDCKQQLSSCSGDRPLKQYGELQNAQGEESK